MTLQIKTSYVSPTNTKGAKIKATFNGKSVSVPYNYALNSEERHEEAAIAFADKHGLNMKLGAIGTHGKGYFFKIVS